MELKLPQNQINKILKVKNKNQSLSNFIREAIDYYTKHLELVKYESRDTIKQN